jgi:hypothetical protein
MSANIALRIVQRIMKRNAVTVYGFVFDSQLVRLVSCSEDTSLHRSQIFRPARNASPARIATRSVAGGEFVSDAGSGSGILRLRPCGCATRGRGGSPSRPPRQVNHATFFSLLMGSSRKNGRLGDPALPSLSSNSFHVRHFHPRFLESPSGCCRIASPSGWLLRARPLVPR